MKREDINLETGYLSPIEANALLNTLPIDISFMDEDDKIRYLNNPKMVEFF